ncbi:fumarylacetoacetate hydrolase family protein [Natronosporangium hydrolyticum]|uniref:Fumarylacetoacetate hydrolase family protein n=1 Tax=Natronosporangium hydrolyticum TaxID=2811111 RepID=A0A895YL24_9ACTN|nr:fumarylacetoacetate hydrolase family protein [Natronosporangium hydrolyticum]QSB15366.1 fumarylacetoacetate hydrolase family protein [Natronosporangium hydrolyticum]
MGLWRLGIDGRVRLARGPAESGPVELLPESLGDLESVLASEHDGLREALDAPGAGPVPPGASILAPVASQDVWAAGVTYSRSRDARNEESGEVHFYDLVYEARRPELFFKSSGPRVRGPGQPVGVRADSTWDVPEPELGLVANAAGRLLGYVVGNDVSSRSIEGENPLYLPQAKCYTGSCSLGPCIVPVDDAPPLADLQIRVLIRRAGSAIFEGTVAVADMRRRPTELLDWLFRAMDFPVGAVLLTGTALIPPSEFALQPQDEVAISINGLGTLRNPVELVGRPDPELATATPVGQPG